MCHYDTPLYLEEVLGGWTNRQLVDAFEKYAKVIFEEYKGLVRYWLTFNEINSQLMMKNFVPNAPKQMLENAYAGLHNQFVASARAVKLAHEQYPEYVVGCMIAGMTTYPLTCDPQDVLRAQHKMQEDFYYSGDVMIRGHYPVFAKRMWREDGVSFEVPEEDLEILKEGRADFFSFPTTAQAVRRHIQMHQKTGQAIWYSDIKTHTSSILTGDGVWMRTDCDTF